MQCNDLVELIDPWAEGELTPPPEALQHVDSCNRCASRLALARQIDRVLASYEVKMPSPQFSQEVLRRVRREWWEAEEDLDWWFNVLVGGGLLAVVGGVWLLFDLSGLTALTGDATTLIGAGMSTLMQQVGGSMPVYLGATGLLIGALMIWRWTDGDLV
ncbi:MAG: anti-sigma factor family protein [Vicinamibacterales bacterium]